MSLNTLPPVKMVHLHEAGKLNAPTFKAAPKNFEVKEDDTYYYFESEADGRTYEIKVRKRFCILHYLNKK